ncbi:2-amino-4-hydroxy-6-hydroxymethyldihydropteridine diphosphokinase [Rhizobium sp. SSA_523]|uniref:2-amino-4-hydroxy-6- hydroxymethyldihydropteridine diphosphokinase n=1 Tax=Rhizobium sp. SSA_523 TaxID=2952477 RepID=UPI002090C0A1|nr:2-amino-4-hydroxy-6-hydroxymethyldihydropteridine diphosphokinase [Rhizobium sp. SSA_523]MCO5729984.1 2-amino-4-hydroxy-6-hydroxymethyldihydropteridine diphosphokinase [Rhizobium sp. SSA_523]WKC25060.1 2-amino-4-hydroxy-6-hydroxymethyldihydropteridine diphosphokinase [Rhizobium sp. SSA_523]
MNTGPDDRPFVEATLGLGGNLGNPRQAMGEALRLIDSHAQCRVSAVSRLYRTPPWGKTDQADFINACALIHTRLSPRALLDLCLEIERSMKRVRIERWGPRTIDLDVLTYGDLTIHEDGLEIPHPRMQERAFVLMPLADIAAERRVFGKTVSAWLGQADTKGIAIDDPSSDWWRSGLKA